MRREVCDRGAALTPETAQRILTDDKRRLIAPEKHPAYQEARDVMKAAEYQAMMRAGVLTRSPNGRVVPAGDPKRDPADVVEAWRDGETAPAEQVPEDETPEQVRVITRTLRPVPRAMAHVRGWLIGFIFGVAMMFWLVYEIGKAGAFK